MNVGQRETNWTVECPGGIHFSLAKLLRLRQSGPGRWEWRPAVLSAGASRVRPARSEMRSTRGSSRPPRTAAPSTANSSPRNRSREERPCAARRSSLADSGGSGTGRDGGTRSEEHTSELQSLMRISYAVFCLKKKKEYTTTR